MEVVEEDIIGGKAGKGIAKAADDGILIGAHKPPDIEIGSQSHAGGFEHEERRHEIGHHPAGEGKGQPEEGAEQQIETVRRNEVRAQVGIAVPEHFPGTHGIMGHAVERNLLDIEVPEEEKVPLFIDDEGQEHDSRRQQRNAEGQQPSGHLAACGLCVDLCLFRLHTVPPCLFPSGFLLSISIAQSQCSAP
jgi:hypothetical protein